jgi:hypothetical protein
MPDGQRQTRFRHFGLPSSVLRIAPHSSGRIRARGSRKQREKQTEAAPPRRARTAEKMSCRKRQREEACATCLHYHDVRAGGLGAPLFPASTFALAFRPA